MLNPNPKFYRLISSKVNVPPSFFFAGCQGPEKHLTYQHLFSALRLSPS